MSEEDIKLKYITPALRTAGWELEDISMECRITDGRIQLKGGTAVRQTPKRADYLLCLSPNNPIAVIEAKDNRHSLGSGLQQAMEYAKMLDLPFAYSSNGDGFLEHDFLTGSERELGLNDFPAKTELSARYKQESNQGRGLTPNQERTLAQPYYSDANTVKPRYYQRIAVNRTVDAIARGQNRLLLVMATGTDKTYTAFQIIYRLLQSGLKNKVLYLADRNILVDQSISGDFAPLKKVVHKINVSRDDPAALNAYQVYFSLYQQLVGDDGREHYSRLFKPDFFDLIIVDECHRGSAKEESRWRQILEYFSSAAQIGMTATPKETQYISNISYFGEPLYSYSLKEGIDDGFLAPFKVIRVTTNIDGEGWKPGPGQLDKYGRPIEDRLYTGKDFDYSIIVEDRTQTVAEYITRWLKAVGRMSKTIVFCPTEEAAERMRLALVNLNADMVRENPDYVVRITGSDAYGKSKLDYFISVSEPYPVIATTSKLLSTGVDCKMVKLIALDSLIGSMTEFKQIIGRGTRLREKEGKTHFTVMDFRQVTQLFDDPDWDGPVEIDENFEAALIRENKDDQDAGDPDDPDDPKEKPIVGRDGCRVEIVRESVAVYDADGRLLCQTELLDYARSVILEAFPTREDFVSEWFLSLPTDSIKNQLQKQGLDLEVLKADHRLTGCDDFDLIGCVAFDQPPLTRSRRAERLKARGFFERYGGTARAVLEAAAEKYVQLGIYEIGKAEMLKLEPFTQYGKPAKIAAAFGGRDSYQQAMRALQNELYQDTET